MAQWACYVALGMASASAALPVGLAVMARADTLNSALISAYQNNPQLNSQRAVVRETDESVPQALSGYRPSVSVTGQFGPGYSSIVSKDVGPTGEKPFPVTSFHSARGGFSICLGVSHLSTLRDDPTFGLRP